MLTIIYIIIFSHIYMPIMMPAINSAKLFEQIVENVKVELFPVSELAATISSFMYDNSTEWAE